MQATWHKTPLVTPARTALVTEPYRLYVHLCAGEILEIPGITGVRVTQDGIEALTGDEVVATFDRGDVYFAADRPMEPPVLN